MSSSSSSSSPSPSQQQQQPQLPQLSLAEQFRRPGTELKEKIEQIRSNMPIRKVFYFNKLMKHDLSMFDGRTIRQIVCGAVHYLILTEDHELYAVGSNAAGQLGHLTLEREERKPVRMIISPEHLIDPINEKIIKVSTKGWHNLVLLNSGRVFANGSNKYGQLGLDRLRAKDVRLLTPVSLYQRRTSFYSTSSSSSSSSSSINNNNTNDEDDVMTTTLRIEIISAGVNHSVIASHDGIVYSCGWGQHGQTGHGQKLESLSTFTRVQFFDSLPKHKKRIRDISSGGEHSLVLMMDGSVYVMGHFEKTNHMIPTLITSFDPLDNHIVQITSGDFFAMVLTSKSNIYSFGENERGQCGLGSGIRFATHPTRVVFYEKPSSPSSTPTTSSNTNNNNNNDNNSTNSGPALIPMSNRPPVKKIVAGSSHSLCICAHKPDEEIVFAWGRGEADRLGVLDYGKNHYTPVEVECLRGMRVKQISASGMYTLLCNSEVPPDGYDKYIRYMFGNLKHLLQFTSPVEEKRKDYGRDGNTELQPMVFDQEEEALNHSSTKAYFFDVTIHFYH